MNAKLLAVIMLAALPSVASADDMGTAPGQFADSSSTGGGEGSKGSTQQNNADANGSDANGTTTPSGSDSDANAGQTPANGGAAANKK
jgi:hypothetical protein